jgi:L-ascorbate metabolism protein UlaG (beta-lactamase superfamily)
MMRRRRPWLTLALMLALTWAGHATVLIELDGVRVLTDPVLRDSVGPLVRTGSPVAPERYQRIDFVLLSHLHADHADVPSLRRVVTPLVIGPRGTSRWLERRRVPGEVREVGPGDELEVGAVRILATAAAHGGRRWPLVGVRAAPVGYVLTAASGSVYFAGDTDLFPAMAELAGSIDVALLPVAGWGPALGPGHLDAARAAEAVLRIAPRLAVPIHWGTLAPRRPLKAHPHPDRPPRDFADIVARRAPGVDVRVLEPGERTVVAQPPGFTPFG